VATRDFFFSLEFSSQGAPAALLEELVAKLLEHVGSSERAIPELAGALQKAVDNSAGAGQRRCDIQFKAHGATLEIVVAANGGRIWQTSRNIPS
jgi:hypothetical protein